ncbi:MAG: HTTM domain-containing protein, partial [Tepidisphaeraceae bacterium]
RNTAASTFHVPPVLPWLPIPTPLFATALMCLQYVAAAALLFGVWTRATAWFLAGIGLYVLLLDPEHFSHNAYFHVTLLVLIGCASDRVSLARLINGRDADARCPAWPEQLVRIQVAIVFFYAALDKVFSPNWGLGGRRLLTVRIEEHGLGLNWIQRLNELAVRSAPGALSVATIIIEFFLALAPLIRRLWAPGLIVGLLFMTYLEFLVKPGLFAWDIFAAGILFLPAGDGAWQIRLDPRCAACRRTQALLLRLDWLRRIRAIHVDHGAGIELISPRGRTFSGFDAVRVLPCLLVGPLFIVLATARFAGGFLTAHGFGPWEASPYLLVVGYLVLWIPGVARLLDSLLGNALRRMMGGRS